MDYYLDTEFHEYHKQVKCCGVKIGKPIPTVDLISIGIVGDNIVNKNAGYDGTKIPYMQRREYYAISKDFNIKDAWNSYQLVTDRKGTRAEYWLRDNVLKSIFKELLELDGLYNNILVGKYYRYPTTSKGLNDNIINELIDSIFTLKNLTKVINYYGKTNKEIAREIKEFVYKGSETTDITKWRKDNPINFYAYYADYNWVVFAQLFGKMINLPKGFPMYCRDLKQMLDDKLGRIALPARGVYPDVDISFNNKLKEIKTYPNYPKQDNEHNALDDAKWNKKLHNFITTL